MSKRTPVEIEKKVIVAYKTRKYTTRELSHRFHLPSSTIWGILNRMQIQNKAKTRHPSKTDMITVLHRINFDEDELAVIWDIMKQALRKRASAIKLSEKVYEF